MSRILDEMPARKTTRARYPWDEWTDGRVWEITRGQDFTVSAINMSRMLYTRARMYSGRFAVTLDGDVITFQFTKTAQS